MTRVRMREGLEVHVGESLRDTADRVLQDVARFEHGDAVVARSVSFENWRALFNVLTPKRYELLRHIHDQPEPSIRALARALDRDFKRVHEDVQALTEAGLLSHDEAGLRADYDRIETAIPL